LPDWLHVTGIAKRQAQNSCIDPCRRICVAKPPQPFIEFIRADNFNYPLVAVCKLHFVKHCDLPSSRLENAATCPRNLSPLPHPPGHTETDITRILFAASLFALASPSFAQVTADTIVTTEQFNKSCKMTIAATPKADAYCGCVALQLEKSAASKQDLMIARQIVAGMDPEFGQPTYAMEDSSKFVDISNKMMEATGVCGKAATMNTLNEDGTLQ
jgi:hypothetical protein